MLSRRFIGDRWRSHGVIVPIAVDGNCWDSSSALSVSSANDDWLDGGAGGDRLVGDAGLDRESDSQDRFAEGEDDGDGYDND